MKREQLKKCTILAGLSLFSFISFMTGFEVEVAEAFLFKHHAQHQCGDTVTSNVWLTRDLDCSGISPGTFAIKVGASDVTINLGGHTIIGPQSTTACPAGGSDDTKGIVVEGASAANPLQNVTILHGKITGFARGVRVKYATNVHIIKLEAYMNVFSAVRIRENAEVTITYTNFHDNLNDHIGVSAGSRLTLKHSKLVDGCASGTFLNPAGGSNPGAHGDLKNNYIANNFRSGITYWGASGSAENNFLKGNNSNTAFSFSSDFGQISLINLDDSDILLRCNVIRDSVDSNGSLIENAIGFRNSVTTSTVEIIKNLFVNNPVAVWFSKNGSVVGADINKNTFKNNATDFDLVGDSTNWTVDASKNFYAAGIPVVSDTGTGNSITVDPILKIPRLCLGIKGQVSVPWGHLKMI